MATVLLETQRLVLRQFSADDLDLLVALDSDPDVMRYITGGTATSRDELAEVVLPRWLRYYEDSSGFGFWAAEDRQAGEFVGWFHLRPSYDREVSPPELGYRIARRFWGLGLATEGSIGVLAYAFNRLQVERIVAETMVAHAASRRVMEKAGLRLVEYFTADWPHRIPGDEFGDVRYAADRVEWLTLDLRAAATIEGRGD